VPAVETRKLTRRFGRTVVVDNLDLQVQEGEVFGLLGPNGAGKTTTIKMLITLLPPSEGDATVAGFDVVREPRHVRRSIGYVPQMVSVDGALTGYENLLVSARLARVPRGERPARIAEVLEFLGLSHVRDQLARQYSGGMIRRLELAQALVSSPRLLILDEPTIGLDPVARTGIWKRIAEVRARTGMTVLVTTHYMDEAEEHCDRVALMHRGRIRAEGTPAELIAGLDGAGDSLDDVFRAHTGDALEAGGFRDVSATRRTARRLG
jgi:ABC-2 type transport system ATP-binding protein